MRLYPDTPGLYDLLAFSEKLPKGGDFKKLKGTIKSLINVGSAYSDLELSKMYSQIGNDLETDVTPPRPRHASHAAAACYNWALILYCRATQTSSKFRGGTSVHDKYRDEDKTQHKVLMALRNDAVAHFGQGPDPANPWSKDAAILRINDKQDMDIFTPPFRRAFKAEINSAVARLDSHALYMLQASFNELTDQFYGEYAKLLPRYPAIKDILSRLPFDASHYAEGSSQFAKDMMEGHLDDEIPSMWSFPPNASYFDAGDSATKS